VLFFVTSSDDHHDVTTYDDHYDVTRFNHDDVNNHDHNHNHDDPATAGDAH
jgi:hypothetical protein